MSGQTGERLTYNGLRLLLYRLGRRSGVANCHAHSFRRTFAVWSLQAGMNVHALRLIMGHSDLTILQRYLDLTEHDLGQAHHQHGAVDSKL